MLNNLTAIEVRVYYSSTPTFPFTRLSRSLRDTLITLFLSPSVTNLSIEGIVDLPYELAQRCASIPNVELECLSFLPEPDYDHYSPCQHLVEESRTSGLKSLSIANAQIDRFQPLLEALQNEECKLETLIVAKETWAVIETATIMQHDDGTIEHLWNPERTDECIIAETLMQMYNNTLTTFECQRPTDPFIHNFNLDVIDISVLPHLRTVKFGAMFCPWRRTLESFRDALNKIRQALAKATEENEIQEIVLNVRYPILSNCLTQTYDETYGWKALDKLLTSPKFQKLIKVYVRLSETTLELRKEVMLDDNEVSETLYHVAEDDHKETKESVLRNYLPRLHEEGLVVVMHG
ncbi:hypothetical protein BDQ17DRAFT_1424878 [Cyathus striatus]|nr:hypothetical protein BDQ17DRAFT_1424878 [Cyathus striatus]